jgi:uncharacterized metal-binding protein
VKEPRHRIFLSIVIVVSFLFTIHAISVAMHNGASISGDWKELLLLMLGAMIGNFSKVVDYWFNPTDKYDDQTKNKNNKSHE